MIEPRGGIQYSNAIEQNARLLERPSAKTNKRSTSIRDKTRTRGKTAIKTGSRNSQQLELSNLFHAKTRK